MTRHRLRHGDRVAYASDQSARSLRVETCGPRCNQHDLGTVVVHRPRADRRPAVLIIWDSDLNVDQAGRCGILNESDDGVAYAVVTAESRRTTRAERRWRAAKAIRLLDKFCAGDE